MLALARAGRMRRLRAPDRPTRDDIVDKLNKFESAPEIDVAGAAPAGHSSGRRSRSKKRPASRNKRPPIVARHHETADLQCRHRSSTSIRRSCSRRPTRRVGRIADAMVHSPMLPYGFLIVGHTESNGNRETNVILSQRRADAIRDMLVNTFKIATKRRAIGRVRRGAIHRPGAPHRAGQQPDPDHHPDRRCRSRNRRPQRARGARSSRRRRRNSWPRSYALSIHAAIAKRFAASLSGL